MCATWCGPTGLLAERGVQGEAYNVCRGTAHGVRELAEALIARARHPMHLAADDGLLRPVDVAEVRGDPAKLRATTGWRPEVPVEQTLDDLLDHWRSEATGSELSQSPNSCGGGTPTGSEVPHLHDSQ